MVPNPTGATLSPRGSLAPSGGGAVGCEPAAAGLPVRSSRSEATNGQPFAFDVRTARYKLMHYVGGERTVREVSHSIAAVPVACNHSMVRAAVRRAASRLSGLQHSVLALRADR